MSNQNEFEYIDVKEFLHLPVIEISEVKSFVRFANANDVKYIFKISKEKNIEFFFPHGGIVYKISGNGFAKLNDMVQAQARNFPTAKEYYEAEKAGFNSYQEYVDLSKTGVENKDDYEAAYKAGFVKGFDKFKAKYSEYQKQSGTSVIPKGVDNPVKLHQFALQKDIKTFDDFEKIYNAGFPDQLTYKDASSKGFTEGGAYYDAITKGFSEQKEYKEAAQLQIDTKRDYDEYRHLKEMNSTRNYQYDKLQLLIALSNLDNGKVVSVADAKSVLQKAQEKLKKPAGDEGHRILPMWYTRSIDQEDKLIEFLKTNEELKKFGFFNTDKNSFEIFKASAIKIFVDGSNVAHNNKGEKVKPDIKNIRLLVKELNFYKFKDVTVIADASLRHKVKDLKDLDELKKECDYYEAPAKTTADEFLIESIKKQKCLVVSNDTFEDWKKKDKWVADKIDSIRIPFTITKDEHVILKGMEKFREKPVEA